MIHLRRTDRLLLLRSAEHLHGLGPQAMAEAFGEVATKLGGLQAIFEVLTKFEHSDRPKLRVPGASRSATRSLQEAQPAAAKLTAVLNHEDLPECYPDVETRLCQSTAALIAMGPAGTFRFIMNEADVGDKWRLLGALDHAIDGEIWSKKRERPE